MPTQFNIKPLEFEPHRRRRVVTDFEGGPITSDAGALLLRRVERHLSLFGQVADCFTDHRDPKRIRYSLHSLITQRILCIALATRISTTNSSRSPDGFVLRERPQRLDSGVGIRTHGASVAARPILSQLQ